MRSALRRSTRGIGDPRHGVAPSTLLVALTAVALMSVFICYLLLETAPPGDAKSPATAYSVFLTLCAFEACLGAYMPTMASLKASHVPDASRATIYSLFRVPLNAIVISVLLISLSSTTTFLLGTALLAICLASAVGARRKRRDCTRYRHWFASLTGAK